MSAKAKLNKKSRFMLSSAHILIAVVALIECLIMIAFTTYSWIETASSLIIKNGRQTTTVDDIESNYINIDITNELSYAVNLDASAGTAKLNQFFSHVKNYRYGKASSTNGIDFYFPKRNNTHQNANDFRKGDTTDYNTSYTYFDFVIHNNIGNKDFFFSDSSGDVFTVTNNSGYNFTAEQLKGIKAAMRISINDNSRSGNNTAIYSVYNGSTETYTENGQTRYYYSGTDHNQYTSQNGTAASATSTATVRKISDYSFSGNTGLSGDNVRKLFTSKRGEDNYISVRIWFEIMDPIFQRAFGFGMNQSSFDSDAFNAIPGVEIGINLNLGNADNNFVPFYFDDYTFSTVSGHEGENLTAQHIGEANDDYIVTFRTWNPEGGSNNTGGWQTYELEYIGTSNGRSRWSASEISMTVTNHLKDETSSGITTAHYNDSYFTYGRRDQSPELIWRLNTSISRTGNVDEFIYNAYSVTNISGSSRIGAGLWNSTSRMELLRFKDMGTVLVQDSFNRSAENYQIVNQHPVNTLFVNTISTYDCTTTSTLESDAKQTATMYYDETNEIFMSYVPYTWIDQLSDQVYFRFNLQDNPSATGTTGGYGYNDVDMKWVASAPRASSNDQYIYTNLGQGEDYYLRYYQNNKTNVAPGIGTWGSVEKISFNAELIDYRLKSTDRYKVCVDDSNLDFGSSSPKNNYPLIPNAEGMVYSAYVPAGYGITSDAIRFLCVNGAAGATNNILARWYSPLRDSIDNTFYPTAIGTTEVNGQPRGYWNLSVLTDGSYENLIYDTLTDGDGQGTLEYSDNGGATWITIMSDSSTAGSPSVSSNGIDEFRWYVPCQVGATVYYRWTPYADDGVDEIAGTADDTKTEFIFEHDTSYGMYLVVTEASSSVVMPSNGNTTTRGLSGGLAPTGDIAFDAEVVPSASQSADALAQASEATDAAAAVPEVADVPDENYSYGDYDETYYKND